MDEWMDFIPADSAAEARPPAKMGIVLNFNIFRLI